MYLYVAGTVYRLLVVHAVADVQEVQGGVQAVQDEPERKKPSKQAVQVAGAAGQVLHPRAQV